MLTADSNELPRQHVEPVQIITANSIFHRIRYILRTQVCLVILLFASLLVLISVLSWQQPVNPSGWGCDAAMSPPHTANRQVGTTFCAKHDPLASSNAQIETIFPKSDQSARFFVIGDYGRDGYCCQLDVAYEMARTAQTLDGINFVLNVGDAFYTHGLLSPKEEQVKTSFENIYLQYPELRVPWFSALGNHEYRGSAEAVLQLSANFSEYFTMEARFWERVYSRGGIKVHLYFLDTTPMISAYRVSGYDDEEDTMINRPDGFTTQNVTEQLVWFEERLKASQGEEVKIVIGHHPPFTSGSHFGEDDRYLRNTLTPLLEKYNVTAYFSGHDHSSQEYKKKNTWYFVSGSGSMTDGEFSQSDEYLRFFSEQNGFLAVDISPIEITVCFVNIVGDVLRTTKIPL